MGDDGRRYGRRGIVPLGHDWLRSRSHSQHRRSPESWRSSPRNGPAWGQGRPGGPGDLIVENKEPPRGTARLHGQPRDRLSKQAITGWPGQEAVVLTANQPRLEGVGLACPAERGGPRTRRPRWGHNLQFDLYSNNLTSCRTQPRVSIRLPTDTLRSQPATALAQLTPTSIPTDVRPITPGHDRHAETA